MRILLATVLLAAMGWMAGCASTSGAPTAKDTGGCTSCLSKVK